MKKLNKHLLILISFMTFNSCAIFEDMFTSCDEESAIWGKASSKDTSPQENCTNLQFVFTNSGTLVNGVSLSAIIAYTGDGPKAISIQFQLIDGTDIRDYNFKNPLKISFDTDTYEFKTNNPDFIAAFDSGFSNTIYEKFDIEIDQKRRDKENYRGYIKCEGTFFKGYNLDGSLNYEPFVYDLKFDTDNN